MRQTEVDKWALKLISNLNSDWKHIIDKKTITGYTIFYSPVTYNPDLMIIGDNPGGTENVKQKSLPKEHEYFKYNYTLANSMREKIFAGSILNDFLKYSVKLNRIFFKSQNMKNFNEIDKENEIKKYCHDIVIQIIKRLEPKLIFAESFGTFRLLSKTEEMVLQKTENNKSLLLRGDFMGIPTLGINHPSRASYFRINNNDWKAVNDILQKIIPTEIQKFVL